MPAIRQVAARLIAAVSCCTAAQAGVAPAAQLRPRAQQTQPALFASLPSDVTGVTRVNSFDDPRCWGELYRAFNNGSLGTGVAVADVDGDGRPDIAATTKTGPLVLYRNLGDFRFEDVTEKAGLAACGDAGPSMLGWLKSAVGSDPKAMPPWSHGIVFADLDNDGWQDLYVCRFGAPNLLYMNRGNGTFSEEAAARGLAISDASVVAAFCDYDRDGWLDVYLQTNLLDERSDGQRDHLLRNRGDGSFVDASDKLEPRIPSQGHSCVWWDFDDDGWPDLYVANDFAAPDLLYHNQRDGTFVDVGGKVLPSTPFSSMGCDTGDVDGDGLIDLFVADMAATSHEKDQRTMAVARYRAPTPRPGEAPQVSRNMLFLGTGVSRVREAAFLGGIAASDWTWSPRLEDFDCDGRLDLLITNGMNREHHNIDLHERANQFASSGERAAVYRDSPVLKERNLAFRNEGELRFAEVGRLWGFDELGVSFGSASGDFDGDGDLDLVVARYDQAPAIYRNDGSAGERVVFRLKGKASNRFGLGAKVHLETSAARQLREIWSARGYQSSSEPAAFFGFAAGDSPRRVQVDWPSGRVESWEPLEAGFVYELIEGTGQVVAPRAPPAPVFERIDKGAPEIVSKTPTAGGAALKTASRLQPKNLWRLGPGVAVHDFDRDGREDLVLGAGSRRELTRAGADLRPVPIAIQLSNSGAPASPLEDGPILAFDADGDGFDDLLVSRTGEAAGARPADYALRLWLSDGHGGFVAAASGMVPDRSICVGSIAAADLDRDGMLEVFVGSRVLPGQYPQGGESMLLRQRGSAWVDVCRETAPGLVDVGMVTAALWSDVDGDGWPDLIVACEWGRVRCFFNSHEGQLLERPGQEPFAAVGAGWWTSLAAADFNRDGRIDYFAGNAGLNTPYHASATQPALLLRLPTGRGRTATALLEAYFEDGRRFPWRTRRDLGAVWPAILKKFPTNDSYAAASIEEIFGPDVIAGAETWAAQELRSGIFMSRPDGQFEFLPLPSQAEIAPIHGIAAGDLDGDGLADACVVQNSSGPLSGSWNGGLGQFLRGRGDGTFDAIAPRDSGFVVAGEGRGLVVFDPAGTGRPILCAIRSADSPLFIAPAGGRSDGFMALRLSQPGRNPDALGARIEINWSDRRVSAVEIAGSAGYMTQTSSVTYVGLNGAAKPVGATVRWPDGTETKHDLSNVTGRIVLDRERGGSAAR